MNRQRLQLRVGLLATTFLLLLSWLVSPSPALAHAELLRTSPKAGSLLDSPPKEIQLFVSESVSLDFSTIKVYDRARREQSLGPLGRVSGDDTSVNVPLNGTLPAGTYTVVWRVLSGADGHLTAGSFAFRVRAAPGTDAGTPEPEEAIVPIEGTGAAGAPFAGSSNSPDPLRWFVRALILATAVFLLGGPILSSLVIEPASEASEQKGKALWPVVGKRYSGIALIAAVLLLVGLLMDLLLQVAAVNGTGLLGALGRIDLAVLTVNSTRYGFAWALKGAAALLLLGIMLLVWLRSKRGGSGLWELAIAAGSLLLLGQSLGSHAAAVAGADRSGGLPLPVINDWLHLTMVATWAGGLGYMALALFPAMNSVGLSPQERRAFLGRAVPRFSRLAIISVLVLGITGTINLAIHSTDLASILGSQYGQVLALKVALYLALVLLGAINLRRLTPKLAAKFEAKQPGEEHTTGEGAATVTDSVARENQPVGQLRRNIRIETVLVCLVLLCTGGLTLLPPPKGTTALLSAQATAVPATVVVSQPPTPFPTAGPATADAVVSGYKLSLTTRPALEGDTLTLKISRVDAASPPLTDVARVLFKVTPQDVDAGSTSYRGTLQGEASGNQQTWSVTETFLTLDGGYMVTAIVQRTESDDLKAAFRLDLSVDTGLKAAASQVVDIAISTTPSPPISGTATLTLTLVDGARQPIDGAKITVSPYMPAHAHVEPEAVAEPVPGQPGTYTLPVSFDMGGSWLFIFNVEQTGLPTLKTDGSMEVIDPNATPTPQEQGEPTP